MREFLKTYRQVIFVLPILYIAGNIFGPLGMLLLFIIMTGWLRNKKFDHAIILTFIILIMGDNRASDFEFVKNLRIVAIVVLGLQTIFDLIKGRYPFQKIILLSIPFWIIATLGGFLSPSVAISLSKMVSYLLLLLVALHFLPYHIKATKGRIAKDVLMLGSWILFLSIFLVPIRPSFVILVNRYRGLLGNPNGLGVFSTMIFMLFMILKSKGMLSRKQSIIMVFLLAINIILSESRTTLGTAGIFLILSFFYQRGKGGRLTLWLFFIPILVLFLNTISLETIVNMVGLGEYLRVESLSTGTGRFLAWQMGWEHIQNNFWIGRGFAYEEFFFKDLREFLKSTEHQGGMHNSYLTFIMNNGILGFVFIGIFYAFLFRKIKAPAYGIPFVISILISANFESWLNSSLNAYTIHFLLILVTLINYPQLKSET